MPKISELFRLKYGHSLELNRLEQVSDGDAINFVGRAARNNGVTARVRMIPGLAPTPGGTVSVALGGQGGAGVAFLQPFPYYCGRDVMTLYPLRRMTEQELIWWAVCISANRFRFGFGRQANRTLKDIELPPRNTIPRWARRASVNLFNGASKPAKVAKVRLPAVDSWKPFSLGELFEIKKGRRLTKANMKSGGTVYIGASDTSNGVTARIGQKPIHDGGTISVSYNGSVAEAFYQPDPFWASDDVNVLYSKGFTLTPATALFICTLIRLEKYRFNYGRKWHLERMREAIVRLPVAASGKPNWRLMHRFVETLPYSSTVLS